MVSTMSFSSRKLVKSFAAFDSKCFSTASLSSHTEYLRKRAYSTLYHVATILQSFPKDSFPGQSGGMTAVWDNYCTKAPVLHRYAKAAQIREGGRARTSTKVTSSVSVLEKPSSKPVMRRSCGAAQICTYRYKLQKRRTSRR